MNLEGELMIIFLVSWPLLFLFYRMITKPTSSKNLPLPPGPYPWPIIGNFFHFGKNLHHRLAEMAQVHGPLMSLHLGQQILIIGSSPIVASEILKTHDHALSGRAVSRLLQNREPTAHNMNLVFTSESTDVWRMLRNIYKSELFSRKALESYTEMRENKVMEMMKYLGSKEGEAIPIKQVAFATSVNILGNATLSIDLVDFEGNGIGANIIDSLRRLAVLAATPQLVDMYPILSRWDLQGWYKQVMHIIQADLGTVWKDTLQMKRNGTNISSHLKDFTDILIEKGFTDQQINPLMQELFAAGTETTSASTEWLMAELLRNKELMQKVRDEVTKNIDGNVVKESDLVGLPFLEACFKETLRLHPAGPLLLPHRAKEACEIMGYTIPKDSQIMVNVWAINRDPNIWDDPLSFKPERFVGSKLSYKGNDFEFLPFGSGRKMCPGEAMASKIVLLTVAALILNFDWILPDDKNPNEIDMEEEMDIAMHKKQPLRVILKYRKQVEN
ncbi:probable (S)-N-methylcoclaurine 3'-hydroxylase isozyme 2 [Cynara cardunculus var. scolymus]|uniref:probable (S)-N-methylcoclaurine 3'-hydroxylase isozyme 2 n=1 Tax=Cynara cardunculus var. scolymus TaxID=59895 RepID=UPI000D62E324|nr:probable (S)-N-methylcoclaurine 3'-hydroxylase isozyme 2 [Cynara cardunculus var. scolymus]